MGKYDTWRFRAGGLFSIAFRKSGLCRGLELEGSVVCEFPIHTISHPLIRDFEPVWCKTSVSLFFGKRSLRLQSGCLATACGPNKEELRVHPKTRSTSPAVQMASSMAVDKPKQPKLDVDQYLSTAISATPADLHPYFESFQDLYSRKYVSIWPLLRYPSAY